MITDLESTPAGLPWVGVAMRVLRAAASGQSSLADAEAASRLKRKRDQILFGLASAIVSQSAEGTRSQLCSDLVGALDWEECDELLSDLFLSPLDYVQIEAVHDAALLRLHTAGKITHDPFPSCEVASRVLREFETSDAYLRAIAAFRDDELLLGTPRRVDVKGLLKNIVLSLNELSDLEALTLAFDTYISFLMERETPTDLDELLEICAGVGNQRRLRIRSTILSAHAIFALNGSQGGITQAITYLVDASQHIPPDYDDQDLLCQEARMLARTDSKLLALLGPCGQVPPPPEGNVPLMVTGRLLVIGGIGGFKRRGLEAIKTAYPAIDCEWLDADEAGRVDQVRALISRGERNVLLYTWVLSHSAEGVARSAAENANTKWDRVRMPGLAGVIDHIPSILRSTS